nr:SIS domain-containing protein [Nitriliruptor alkaliphilus]
MSTLMATEIGEQPDALRRTFTDLLPLRGELRRLAGDRRDVLIVARGSSDNAAVYGRYLLEVHAHHGAALAAPSLATHYGVERDLSDTLVVSISQSGETTEIVAAQAWAATQGARTVAITNGADSALAAGADLALVTPAGPERAVPATKSYTSQLAAIAVIADALGPAASSLEPAMARVPDEVAALIERRAGVDAAVDALASSPATLVSGRGIVYGTALEVALKLEETCLEPVRGLSYADLRHGPIAIVGERSVCVLVAAVDGPMLPGMTELAAQLSSLGSRTVGIGGDAGFQAACDVVVPGPDLPEALAPLGLIVPAQLIVEALARRLGLDPDAPRGLSKITETDRNVTG